MKICICTSLTFTDEALALQKELEALGHEVLMPNGVINGLRKRPIINPILAKTETDAITKHIDKIRESDAILVCNYSKRGIDNYIGANTFIEMAAAHYFGKPIFVLNELPQQDYIRDELLAFDNMTVLDGDLTRIEV